MLHKFIKFNSPSILQNQIRLAHYVVNQSGEKVVVTKKEILRSKREKWQNIQSMKKDEKLLEIKRIENDERLHCDPEQARLTAQSKIEELANCLQKFGPCRDKVRSYNPPENTNSIIDNICKEFFNERTPTQFDSIAFNDLSQKFEFLSRCYQEFNHGISNADLHLIKTIKDVRNFYSLPVIGNSKYDVMSSKSMDLPPNLHVIPEPIRFNPKTDTFFGGHNAFPGRPSELVGLRAKKNYPSFKDNFVWPDV